MSHDASRAFAPAALLQWSGLLVLGLGRFGRSQSVSKYQVSKVWEFSERRRCFASTGHMSEMTTSTISPAVLQTRAMAVERLRPGS